MKHCHKSRIFIYIIFLTLISCELPPSFTEEYYDSKLNYISNFDLEAPSQSSDSKGRTETNTTAAWDWAWRENYNNYSYMNLVNSGTVGTDIVQNGYTLSASNKVWKFSFNNLAKNPFFEDDSLGSLPTSWGKDNTSSTASVKNAAFSHGNYLELKSIGSAWTCFNPSFGTSDAILDIPNNTSIYRIIAYANTEATSIDYIFDELTGVSFSSLQSATSIKPLRINDFIVQDTNSRLFFAKSSSDAVQVLNIDDVRIFRMDNIDNMSLRINLKPKETSPTLVAGRYEFALWIKKPDASLYYDEDDERKTATGKTAEFASQYVTLRITQLKSTDRNTPQYFTEVFPVSDEWTRIALRLVDANINRFDENMDDAVIELSIQPFDYGNPDIGSVLITSPDLHFYISGFSDINL